MYQYRIVRARNGYYYAQKLGRFGWFRVSPFCLYKDSAERCIVRDKREWKSRSCCSKEIVGYY